MTRLLWSALALLAATVVLAASLSPLHLQAVAAAGVLAVGTWALVRRREAAPVAVPIRPRRRP